MQFEGKKISISWGSVLLQSQQWSQPTLLGNLSSVWVGLDQKYSLIVAHCSSLANVKQTDFDEVCKGVNLIFSVHNVKFK